MGNILKYTLDASLVSSLGFTGHFEFSCITGSELSACHEGNMTVIDTYLPLPIAATALELTKTCYVFLKSAGTMNKECVVSLNGGSKLCMYLYVRGMLFFKYTGLISNIVIKTMVKSEEEEVYFLIVY